MAVETQRRPDLALAIQSRSRSRAHAAAPGEAPAVLDISATALEQRLAASKAPWRPSLALALPSLLRGDDAVMASVTMRPAPLPGDLTPRLATEALLTSVAAELEPANLLGEEERSAPRCQRFRR